VDVVVELEAPPLAEAVRSSRALTSAARRRRLDLEAPSSRSHLQALAWAQRDLRARIARTVPEAQVRWRYGVVLNGLAVSLPAADVARLRSIPGVARVHRSARYEARLYETPLIVGADALWAGGDGLRGDGVKIGILDDGVDPTHPFFDPRSYEAPPGFPLGQREHTTAKVIVARAFPPRRPPSPAATLAYDAARSLHATHVAGIAAGNGGVTFAGRWLSGVAPRAYIGNYRVLTVAAGPGGGLSGGAAEIAAGVEQAVRDGMDVLNLSFGRPETDAAGDLVVRAVEGAVAAGVVVVAAAGNDFMRFGPGSVGSPGSAPSAITVGATTRDDAVALFSSAAPTPLSLLLKPELSAPGVGVLSSVPARAGGWTTASGTSMAAPHVAGAAALLRQRRPEWTPADVKSALVLTADSAGGPRPALAGAGVLDARAAASPSIAAEPAAVSFGMLARRPATSTESEVASAAVRLSDVGGGAGTWAVAVEPATVDGGVHVVAPDAVEVPGTLKVSATVSGVASATEQAGWIALTRAGARRRIPYWLGVTSRALSGHSPTLLTGTGTYPGDTRLGRALVRSYRYPAQPSGAGVVTHLAGPEQVFRVRLAGPVANLGAAVVGQARGVRVEPRIAVAGDEDRLLGYAALPLSLNPRLGDFMQPRPIAAAMSPPAGEYDVVFDTPSGGRPGPFRFRLWIDDTRPPTLRVLAASVRRSRPVRIAATDGGSGVDPRTVRAEVAGRRLRTRLLRGTVLVSTGGLRPGRHVLTLHVSDRQETKNPGDAGAPLPNTATLRVAIRIR
jgi:subtilisin family serine protease